MRKPIALALVVGALAPRQAERADSGGDHQEPPRTTRFVPVAGPRGFVTASASYQPNQSLHHSLTFPHMS